MPVTLKTNSCSNGISTSEFDNAFWRTHSSSDSTKMMSSPSTVMPCSLPPHEPPSSPRLRRRHFFRLCLHSLFFLFQSAMFLFALFQCLPQHSSAIVDEHELYMPTRCESCRLFAQELEHDTRRLAPKMSRDQAEAWLIDELEQLCARMLDYRLHKDRQGLARFAKERTGTANAIKRLKERGVQVKMDVDDALLDRPSIESGKLKEHCEWMIEEFEKDIDQWFIHRRNKTSLKTFLCSGRLANEFDGTCKDKSGREEL